jgi:hypothetical protein
VAQGQREGAAAVGEGAGGAGARRSTVGADPITPARNIRHTEYVAPAPGSACGTRGRSNRTVACMVAEPLRLLHARLARHIAGSLAAPSSAAAGVAGRTADRRCLRTSWAAAQLVSDGVQLAACSQCLFDVS